LSIEKKLNLLEKKHGEKEPNVAIILRQLTKYADVMRIPVIACFDWRSIVVIVWERDSEGENITDDEENYPPSCIFESLDSNESKNCIKEALLGAFLLGLKARGCLDKEIRVLSPDVKQQRLLQQSSQRTDKSRAVQQQGLDREPYQTRARAGNEKKKEQGSKAR
jgi:hypothetical protein